MSSEAAPLLSTEDNVPKTPNRLDSLDDVYLRFSSTKKNMILVMVSGCGVINCMFIRSLASSELGLLIHEHRFSDWDVYAFNTTDCQGPRFNGGSCQVSAFLESFVSKTRRRSSLFSVSSIAISMSVFAASFGALIAASYSTFCKFVVFM
jgi:hypothetical protein